jgi:hypothetical protein
MQNKISKSVRHGLNYNEIHREPNFTTNTQKSVQKDELADLNQIRQWNRRVDDALARILHSAELCNVRLDGDEQRLAELGRRVLVLKILIHQAQTGARTIVDAHHQVERRRQQGGRQFGEFLLRVDRAAQTMLERDGECGVHVREHVAGPHAQRDGSREARKVARDCDNGAPGLAALPESIISAMRVDARRTTPFSSTKCTWKENEMKNLRRPETGECGDEKQKLDKASRTPSWCETRGGDRAADLGGCAESWKWWETLFQIAWEARPQRH